MSTLEDLVKELPPDLRRKVEDFARFLVEKRTARTRHAPTFDWAGALKDVDPERSSVDFQHQIRGTHRKP